MDTKQFLSAIKQIAEEKGISEKSVLETIEAAIAAAYKRDYGKKGQIIKAKLDMESGKLEMTQTSYVVEGVDEDKEPCDRVRRASRVVPSSSLLSTAVLASVVVESAPVHRPRHLHPSIFVWCHGDDYSTSHASAHPDQAFDLEYYPL